MAANLGPNPNPHPRGNHNRPHASIQQEWGRKKKNGLIPHQGWIVASNAQKMQMLELLWSTMQGYYQPGNSPLPQYRPVSNRYMTGPLPPPLVVPEAQVIGAVVAHVMGGAQVNPAVAQAAPAAPHGPPPPFLQHPALAGPVPLPLHNNYGLAPAFVVPAGLQLPAPLSYAQLQQSLSMQQWLAIIQFAGIQL